MDIANGLTNLMGDLHECRRAITYRGGEISATAGFKEVADKIASLPTSSSIGTVVDDTASALKVVPQDSTKYCYLKSIGGMTYKVTNENLMPFPYVSAGFPNWGEVGSILGYGAAVLTVNADKSITISKSLDPINDEVRLAVNVESSDYYLTVFKYDASGDNFLKVKSNIGNIPFGESVYIPSATGITYIDLDTGTETEGSCTISIILSKEPYFSILSDTKTTAIKVHGSNLFSFPYMTGATEYGVGSEVTRFGITFKVNSDRSISVNGTATDKATFYVHSSYSLKKGQYCISAECIGDWPSGLSIQTSVSGSYTSLGNTSRARNMVLEEDRKNIFTIFVVTKGTICNNVMFKPMLNIGTVALPYTDYRAPITYSIPEALQVGKGIEGAVDTTDFENSKKITRCKTVALGDFITEDKWNIGNYNASTGLVSLYTYALNDYDIALRAQALCSHLPYTTLQHEGEGIYLTDVINSKYIRVKLGVDTVGLTVDEYENTAVIREKIIAWLKDNNVTLTYALAEPISEDIDASAFDNLLEVEGGGYLEFVTDNGFAPNSTVMYQTIV